MGFLHMLYFNSLRNSLILFSIFNLLKIFLFVGLDIIELFFLKFFFLISFFFLLLVIFYDILFTDLWFVRRHLNFLVFHRSFSFVSV